MAIAVYYGCYRISFHLLQRTFVRLPGRVLDHDTVVPLDTELNHYCCSP